MWQVGPIMLREMLLSILNSRKIISRARGVPYHTTRHQHPFRSIPRGSPRAQIQERQRGAARETVGRRNQNALKAKSCSKPRVLRRNAGEGAAGLSNAQEDAQRVSQPRDRHPGSDRRVDSAFDCSSARQASLPNN